MSPQLANPSDAIKGIKGVDDLLRRTIEAVVALVVVNVAAKPDASPAIVRGIIDETIQAVEPNSSVVMNDPIQQ